MVLSALRSREMSSSTYFKNSDNSSSSEIEEGQGSSIDPLEGEQDDHTAASTIPGIERNVKRRNSSERMVSFGFVRRRIYQRTIGIHPDVTSGPALDLTWSYTALEDVSVDEYEERSQPKRMSSQLRIPKYARIEMLRRECDVSKSDIARHVRMTNAAKAQRVQTLNNLKLEPIEAKIQRFSRMVKRALKLRKTHEEEVKDLWKKSSSFKPTDNLSKTINSSMESTNIITKGSIDSSSRQKFKLCQGNLSTNEVKPNSLDQARHVSKFNLSLEVVQN